VNELLANEVYNNAITNNSGSVTMQHTGQVMVGSISRNY
jgi:hypothetical protein